MAAGASSGQGVLLNFVAARRSWSNWRRDDEPDRQPVISFGARPTSPPPPRRCSPGTPRTPPRPSELEAAYDLENAPRPAPPASTAAVFRLVQRQVRDDDEDRLRLAWQQLTLLDERNPPAPVPTASVGLPRRLS